MAFSATLLAFVSIVLWSFLAFLGVRVKHLNPFFVLAVALGISGLITIWKFPSWKVPLTTFLVGITGIFGYHFLYFSAFKFAPAVETNLMNYLWPLLIVLLSPIFLSGYKLRTNHYVGAFLGLVGASLIISGGKIGLDILHLPGYLLAVGAALVWASYSLMTKRLPPFSTYAIGGFCLSASILSFIVLIVYSPGTHPENLNSQDWITLVLLGLGPMGVAFYSWDAAIKRGDPRIIGSLTYLIPMTSTIILVVLGGYKITWVSIVAMILIVTGAIIGSLELFKRPERVTLANS